MFLLRSLSYLCLISHLFSSIIYANSTTEIFYSNQSSKLQAQSFGEFDEPWAMTFLPNGKLLITEKKGNLLLVDPYNKSKISVKNIPSVAYGGQGGLGDIILHPLYEKNKLIYLSYVEKDLLGKRGAVVISAKLDTNIKETKLQDIEIIWEQKPKVYGSGHFSHRLAFSSDGHLFITSGDRQKQRPAQDWNQNLGKVIRINADGTTPIDNPFQDKGELAKTYWSLGHRNLLGIAFDDKGQLWTHEMGPRHGDEFNLTIAGENYGWPLVSWGNQYSGLKIPNHDTSSQFHSPELYWVPTVAPSGLIIYNGSMFPQYKNNAFIGGLRSEALIRIKIDKNKAYEVERFNMKKRIREVEQGPKGAIWVLEDRKDAKLIKLTPYK
ncbi:MAG: PQQ-dependent sugar dehydrogenase [Poseidonibacter sp.]|uniref:PQQ-dependent sugar dehydrogenase n=1 Tax=Poseidonibacter sp. TaxID=2321188 RepID=UPI00359E2ACD